MKAGTNQYLVGPVLSFFWEPISAILFFRPQVFSCQLGKVQILTFPETNIFAPENVGILLSYWGGLFSGAMLVSGSVILDASAVRKQLECLQRLSDSDLPIGSFLLNNFHRKGHGFSTPKKSKQPMNQSFQWFCGLVLYYDLLLKQHIPPIVPGFMGIPRCLVSHGNELTTNRPRLN